MSRIESVLFDTRYWDKSRAKEWLYDHDMHPIKPLEVTRRFIHARLKVPGEFERLRIKHTTRGIEFVIGFY